MLKRVRVQGFKSLVDTEVRLAPLVVLIGPNAVGKSNFLDALHLLSRLVTERTVEDAFGSPYRGQPLESFTFGEDGLRGLRKQDRLAFSIDVDFSLSDSSVEETERQVRAHGILDGEQSSDWKKHRNLRYRIKIEMLPRSGILRVADERLEFLTQEGNPHGNRRALVAHDNGSLVIRAQRRGRPVKHDIGLSHTILSLQHHPPHFPTVVASRVEIESWRFISFEPRVHMREAAPLSVTRNIGSTGQRLAGFLKTMKELEPQGFKGIEAAVRMLVPGVTGVDVKVNDLGQVELGIRENGRVIPAGVVSDGTLRMLGLLALANATPPPCLVGLEEPENGIHPGRLELIGRWLTTRGDLGRSQYIVTTHSPLLPDHVKPESLFVVKRVDGSTQVLPLESWGPLGHPEAVRNALSDSKDAPLLVSERLLRGDFDD